MDLKSMNLNVTVYNSFPFCSLVYWSNIRGKYAC